MSGDIDSVLESVEEAIRFLSGIRGDIKAGRYSREIATEDVSYLEHSALDYFVQIQRYAEGEDVE